MKSFGIKDVSKIIKDHFGQMAKRKADSGSKTTNGGYKSQTNALKEDMENVIEAKARRTYIFENGNVQREEHDFKDAMKLTSQSINDYSKTMAMAGHESVSGFDNLVVKNYEPKSYIGFSKSLSSMLGSKTTDLKEGQGDGFGFVKSLEPLVDKVLEIIPAEYRRRSDIGKATKVTAKKETYSKSAINSRTRALVRTLKTASSDSSRLVRMEELSKHLLMYPESHGVAVKEQAIPFLLKIRKSSSSSISGQARECLALVGHVDPIQSRGIRVLSIDGGGTRGLMSINMLKKLEEITGQPIHKLFDYICGVSTGALMAALIGCYRVPLNECEEVYREFSLEMFQRSRIVGASKLVFNHAFYDTEMWANILKSNLGERLLIDTARDEECPKMSIVSSIINMPNIQNYMFRNYNLPAGMESHYRGSCEYKMWEAVRASSAAPGYYEECVLGDYVHQDGGLLTNNPTALAIHECRLLWPDEPLQCVVSLGNGRFEPAEVPDPEAYKTIKEKVLKFVQSATDTQGVHTMLHDLLPPSTYFRFNPYMTEDCLLDEIREEKIDQLLQDTEMYLRKNEHKMESAAKQLLLPRRPHQKVNDWALGKLQRFN
ncbi:calcium-independent phospholipase A2-gamma-like [Lineus longissimus]|uniref:calcium-independent phospholipase A2-gamma-like n=1 Tax=Lineus longissimus TaxID=88925 RepID=UPI00315DE214